MNFPQELEGIRVSSLEQLRTSECRFVVSCVAPEVGYVEDLLVSSGFKVFSISPYKRMDNLMVLEVNPEQLLRNIEFPLFKSPNCVSVGTSIALKALSDAYGVTEASVCTFQSLSGRGDAMYPRELVQGNVYPVWGTKEHTEQWIQNEIAALLHMAPGTLSVRANRVGVHIGHFIDVRVKVRDRKKMQQLTAEDVNRMFENFAPMRALAGLLPSLPPHPISVQRDVGTPRPATHNMEYGGMQVAVGNVKLNDGVWDVLFSVVVNNMVRGAYGAALLMAEYYDHLKSHPAALAATPHYVATNDTIPSSRGVPPTPKDKWLSDESTSERDEDEIVEAEVTAPVSHGLTSDAAVSAAREAFMRDPGAAHGAVACEEMHWYHAGRRAWLTWRDGVWVGWDAAGTEYVLPTAEEWTPWTTAFDGARAPFFTWFAGALTNAAFNECDRHVLAGHGGENAFITVPLQAFSEHVARPGSLAAACPSISRRRLLHQSVVAAHVLRACGVARGDRLILLMPHCIEQMVWMLAAKRIGALYVSMSENISLKALSNRMNDCGARLVLTTLAVGPTGASLRSVVSRAIAEFVPVSIVMDVVQHQLVAAAEVKLGAGRLGLKNAPAELSEALKQTFASETTVDLQQVTSKLEMAFSLDPMLRGATAEIAADLQERIYREYMATTAPKVLVVGALDNPAGAMSRSASNKQIAPSGSGTNLESLCVDALHSPPLGAPSAAAAKRASLAAAATLSVAHLWADAELALLRVTGLASAASLMELPDPQLVAALWRLVPPTPLASSHPLLIIYTSGTSGFRPRGLVCDTGGYCSGLARTMRLAFDIRPADVVLVDSSPSWITGQSYGVAGPLLCRATSVFVPPSELVDDDLPAFLAAVVLELGVTVFKASASFFKRLARHKCRLAWLHQQKLGCSLRVATSCGEPLNPELHCIASRVLCPNFINSYWSTEHGAICLSHLYGNADAPLRRDAHMRPMPWVQAQVWLPLNPEPPHKFVAAVPRMSEFGGGSKKGRLVTTQPWPSMMRTIWGDAETFGTEAWLGDIKQFRAVYWSSFVDEEGHQVAAFDLGDLGRRWPDGSFTVVGRSPEVIKVNGKNIGAAEVEGAILKERLLRNDSPVLDCLVVGVNWHEGGMAPVACLILQIGQLLTEELVARLKHLVHLEHGDAWVPRDMLHVTAIPRTHNGKAMRQVVQRLFSGRFLGDVSEMSNPECLIDLQSAIEGWRAHVVDSH